MKQFILFVLSFALTVPSFGQMKTMHTPSPNPLNPENVAPPARFTPAVPEAPSVFPQQERMFNPMNNLTKPGKNIPLLKVLTAPATGTPYCIEGEVKVGEEKSTEQQVQDYLRAIQSVSGLKSAAEEFSISAEETDELGISHIRLNQVWQGIPVFGAEAILHKNQGAFYLFNGRFFPSPKITDTHPTLSAQAAADIARSHLGSFEKVKNLTPEEQKLTRAGAPPTLVIYHPLENHLDEYLAWQVAVVPNVAARYNYFIDAKTGEVLDFYSELCKILPHDHPGKGDRTICTTENEKEPEENLRYSALPPDGPYTANATDLLGQSRLINTYSKNNTYYLMDAAKAMFNNTQSSFPDNAVGVIWTLNANNTSPYNNNFQAYHNTSSNNSWSNPNAVSAHHHAERAYYYFKNTFNRESINGQGGNIISLINVVEDDGSQMDNAFWNGAAMFYGNGNSSFSYPLARALDVAGHEMSHGVIQTTADLIYMGESGALNESFADIFGAMIERQNWKMGEDVVNPNVFPSGALRDLSNPHNGGNSLGQPGWQPAHYSERYTGTQDNGGVHINSGIVNKAFYLIANNTAVGREKAEQVYYRALVKYLVKSSQFVDCRIAVIQAATDLYGANSATTNAAKAAFDAVGIGAGSGTNTQTDVDPNPGAEYILMSDDDYAQLYIFTPSATAVFNPLSTIAPLKRPSITDDGNALVYISTDNRMRAITINWNTLTANEQIIQSDPIWYNVAISRDGNRLAALTTDHDNRIWIYDFDKGVPWQAFTLSNPTTGQGSNTTNDVSFADEIEWDFTGGWVMYDASNKIKTIFGSIDYWDIGFVRVWNTTGNNFGDGFITKLFNGLPENVSVGNPTFSKNSDYIIAFDYIDEYEDEYYLLAANIETGDVGTIFPNDQLSWPSYSVNDKKMVFNASSSSGDQVLGIIPIGNDKISPAGDPSIYIAYGRWGVWFANGERVLTNTEEQTILSEQWNLYPNPTGSELTLTFSAATAGDGQLEVFDLMGRAVLSAQILVSQGENRQRFSVESLSSGQYFVNLRYADKQLVLKFVKQ